MTFDLLLSKQEVKHNCSAQEVDRHADWLLTAVVSFINIQSPQYSYSRHLPIVSRSYVYGQQHTGFIFSSIVFNDLIDPLQVLFQTHLSKK